MRTHTDVQKSKLLFSQAVQCASTSYLSTPAPVLLHPLLPLLLCVSLPEMNNVDPSLFCMNRVIPWIRFSLRTGEPQAYLQALPSNLHSLSVLLIRRPWTRRHSNCSQLLQISHFIPPLWHILICVSPAFLFSPKVIFPLSLHLHHFPFSAHHLPRHHKCVFLSTQFIVRNTSNEGRLKGRVNN